MISGSYQRCSILLVSLISCFTSPSKGSLTSWPQNTEALINQTIRLSCSTSEAYLVNWEHVRCGASRKYFVYFGGGVASPYDSRFRIITDEAIGQYDLEITGVQLEDSGRYRCIDMEGQGERRDAELVVLGSHPVCFCEHMGGHNCSFKKHEDMRVTCQVSYAGNAVPEFKCDRMADVITTDVQRVSGNITYVLVFRADPQTLSDYDTCRTSISNISSSRFQTNAAYVRAEKRQLTIKDPGYVTCSVNSSRTCQYKWVRVDRGNKTVSTEQKILIAEPGLYRCEADCQMADVYCRVEPVEVNFQGKYAQPESAPGSVVVVVVVVVVLVLVCASVSVVGIFLRNRHQKSKAGNKGETGKFMRK